MAFINEAITPEDKKKYNLDQIKGYYGQELKDFAIRRWTIDRDREAFLIKVGGLRPDPHEVDYFVFYWKGYLVDKIGAEVRSSRSKTEDCKKVDYFIKTMAIPQEIFEDIERKTVLEMLKEAFVARGKLGYTLSDDQTKEIITVSFGELFAKNN